MVKTHLLVSLAGLSLITLITSTGNAQTSSPEATPQVGSTTPPTAASGPPNSPPPAQPPQIGTGNSLPRTTVTKTQDEQFSVPSSANSDWQGKCVNKSLNLNGDFQSVHSLFGLSGQWSVGPAVSTQLVKYDMAKKQAGFNTSVGAGASFRFYRPIEIKDETTGKVTETVFVGQVRSECRQTSFGSDRKSYRAAPMFSITPTLYATKPTNEADLAVQPALLLGFFEDILNLGVGFNLTGPPGEKGNVFLLMSIGTGFSF